MVPKEQQILFHKLANSSMEGPRLRCKISESLRIKEPSPELSTLDRLKNYNKENVDLDDFDGLLCTTFASASTQTTEEEESEMYNNLTEKLQGKCSDQAKTLFASSTDDAELPRALNVKAWDALHQTIEECCAVADHLNRSSALRNKLEEFLSESKEFERNKRKSEDELKPAKKPKHVHMTNIPYKGPSRVFNTHGMVTISKPKPSQQSNKSYES